MERHAVLTDRNQRDGRIRIPRWLGSPQFAAVLLAILAIVFAGATILEATRGAELARWYVYESGWLVGLLTLLAVNVLAAMLRRWPFRRQHLGFVITHAGILTLLLGALLSYWGGVEGQVVVTEGESTDSLILSDRAQLTATWVGKPEEPPYEFQFRGGPVDWSAGRTVDIGEVDGVGVRVLRYLRHAKPVDQWIDDDGPAGGPLVRFKLSGPKGELVSEGTLSDEGPGAETLVGPIRLLMQRAATDRMLEDFQQPPDVQDHPHGLLTIYSGDSMQRVPVEGGVGKRISVDDHSTAVEIVEYLPNARPDRMSRFQSQGDSPKNPLVELRVHLPGRKEPLRQIAFAKKPLLTLDGVNNEVCPVKFRYDHPAAPPPTSVEFLQTRDGRLHGRVATAGAYQGLGPVSSGQRIALVGGFEMHLTSYSPKARREVIFESVPTVRHSKDQPESAVHVAVRVAGVERRAWLRQNDPIFGSSFFTTPEGFMQIGFEQARRPLGFQFQLAELRDNGARIGAKLADWSSTVRMKDQHRGDDRARTIALSRPIVHGQYTFHTSHLEDPGHGKRAATFLVTHDPGRTFKYLGGLMVCVGIGLLFTLRSYFQRQAWRRALAQRDAVATRREGASEDTAADVRSRRIDAPHHPSPAHPASPPSADREPVEIVSEGRQRGGGWNHLSAWLVALGLVIGSATSVQADEAGSAISAGLTAEQWRPWLGLAVHHGDRLQPLDTLARDSLRQTLDQATLRDPVTGARLAAAAAYLALIFDWQGWEHPENERLLKVQDWRPEYGHLHAPDNWDATPLFRVADPELRGLLGVSKDQARVAPAHLAQATVADALSERTIPFAAWAMRLEEQERAGEPISKLEAVALELARRYWAYQDLRMGRSCKLLPARDVDGQWMSFAQILLTPLDNATDPSGRLRDLQKSLWEARQAYRAHDATEFQAASQTVAALLQAVGPEIGAYPPSGRLAWEVRYSHWAPLHWAWILMLTALVAALAQACWGGRWMFALTLTANTAGVAAALLGLGWRTLLAGGAPVTSMYESVVCVGTAVATLGLYLTLRHGQRSIAIASATAASLLLALADQCPAVLDPTIRPLEPILRNNFWLVAHVMTVTTSYALFALSMALGNLTLGVQWLWPTRDATVRTVSECTRRALQSGVFLLAVGTLLGCVGADYAWGRFWSWDQKEVWAVVTLLAYVAILHARMAGWISRRGLAFLSVAGFSLVVISWYGAT